MNERGIINKTMDLEDLRSNAALAVLDELNSLIVDLRQRRLRVSSWFGVFDLSKSPIPMEQVHRGYGYEGLKGSADDVNFPWFKYWEIAWIVLNNEFSPNHKVLDLGGSSSLFSFYLASKGLDVTTIDIQTELVDNANHVAKQMAWNLGNDVMDIRELSLGTEFDHITSICVFEHLPVRQRIAVTERIKNSLVRGGKFSITFDYRRPDGFAQINTPKDVHEQFIKPSGLRIRGNKDFIDNGKSYLLHPFYYKRRLWRYKAASILRGDFSPWEFLRTKSHNDFTFGALFLEKER